MDSPICFYPTDIKRQPLKIADTFYWERLAYFRLYKINPCELNVHRGGGKRKAQYCFCACKSANYVAICCLTYFHNHFLV